MTVLALADRRTPAVPPGIDVLGACMASLGPHTLRAYSRAVEDFAAFLGHPGASDAVEAFLALDAGRANAAVLYYRVHLEDAGLSPATIALRLAAIRTLAKWARILGRVTWSIEVESPRKEAYRDTRGPGADGWEKMLRAVRTAAAEGDVNAIRDLAIVRLLHDLGLRRGEACALDFEDLDQERGAVSVVGKGRKQARALTLPGPTMRALAGWLQVRGTHPGPLFSRLDNAGAGDGRLTGESVRRLVKKWGLEAGLQNLVRPHGLRHQAITAVLAGSNGNLEAGMAFARHADPRTTMLYNDNRADLAGQMARMIAGED